MGRFFATLVFFTATAALAQEPNLEALKWQAPPPAPIPDGGLPPEPPTPTVLAIRNTSETEFVEELLDDGKHVRFGTRDKGAVHVWWPSYYRPQGATVVVYLHGYYTDADGAFEHHHLSSQFRDSNRNSVFVVPEAPSWRTDGAVWKDLSELLDTVFRRVPKLKRPDGDLMVVGHSGAYRSVAEWVKTPKLATVVLLDGHYGADKELKEFLELTDNGLHQLVLVGFDTSQHSEWWLRKHPEAVKLDGVPFLYDKLPPEKLRAKVLYFYSERFDHFGIVTSGKVMPMLLHLLN